MIGPIQALQLFEDDRQTSVLVTLGDTDADQLIVRVFYRIDLSGVGKLTLSKVDVIPAMQGAPMAVGPFPCLPEDVEFVQLTWAKMLGKGTISKDNLPIVGKDG